MSCMNILGCAVLGCCCCAVAAHADDASSLDIVPAKFDYTLHVAPSKEGPQMVDTQSQMLDWVQVERARVDAALPSRPMVPPGLQGVFWALTHVSTAWRLVLPVPPEQMPEFTLALAANSPRQSESYSRAFEP